MGDNYNYAQAEDHFIWKVWLQSTYWATNNYIWHQANAIVYPKIFMQHIWPIFNKSKHTYERSEIEIRYLRWHIVIFNRENSQEQEQISCRDFLWGMFTSFLHKVVPQNNLNNFANYHLDLLQYKIPVYIDITFIAVYRFPFISQMSYHSQGI